MLYICAVPPNSEQNSHEIVPHYVLDVYNLSNRRNISYQVWADYRNVFNWEYIWIVEVDEMQDRIVTNVKFHKGETV